MLFYITDRMVDDPSLNNLRVVARVKKQVPKLVLFSHIRLETSV